MSPEAPRPPRLPTAVAWSFALNAGRRFNTTAVTLVLAAILGPEAFGTVAIATLYVLLLQLVFQQGFGPAIIHQPDLDEESLQAAYRLAAVGSLVLMLSTWAISRPLGALMNDDVLPAVLVALSMQLPLHALGLVPESLLRRASSFRILSFRANVSALTGGLLGIVLALLGAGVWSLVAQQLATLSLATALIWHRTTWRPNRRISVSRSTTRRLLAYSSRTSVASAAQFGGAQFDSLLVGAIFGPTAVGLYRLAGRLVDTVLDLGIRPIQSALLPELVRTHAALGDIAERSVRMNRLSCSLAMPPLGVLGGSAGALVPLLGDQWRAATGPLLLLSLAGISVVFTSAAIPVFQALGKPGILARLQVLSAILVVVPLVGVGALMRQAEREELDWIAGARGLVGLTLVAGLHLWTLRKHAGVDVWRYTKAAVPGLMAAVAAIAVGSGVHVLARGNALLVDASLSAAASASAALLFIALLDRELTHRALTVATRLKGFRRGDQSSGRTDVPQHDYRPPSDT